MSDQRQMHDYSGSQRGRGIGRKSITITLKRRGGSGQIGKETRTLTIPRTAALANMRFDTWDMWNPWEIKPVKSEYAEGESVYVMVCVKNTGETASKGTTTVKDLDTLATVSTFTTPELAPNERWKTSGSHAYIGKMPNRDWRLDFTVTP